MVDALQEQLEMIYGIRCEHRAKDFLVDEEAAEQLGSTGRAREELLVSESEAGLEMALYLEPALLERLSANEPTYALNENLNDFCEVAEGVSHFLYMAHTAGQERQVSLLELEAQAEVDKFAMCTLLRWDLHVGSWAQTLSTRLFDEVSYRPQLSPAELHRYQEANRLAKRYCQRLVKMVRAGRRESLLAELRHGYRLGADAKLQYFGRAA